MQTIDWDDLKYFLAVTRERSLSGAAKVLEVNHTTVSRRIHGLQEEVGARLFDRLPDGWVPTVAGEDIRRVAERVESEILSLDARVLGQDERLSGRLIVTTIDLIVRRHAACFREFTKRYPNVELEVYVANEMKNLSKREADVALRVTNTPPEHLFGRKLGRFEFALYGSKRLVDARGGDHDPTLYPWLGWGEHLGAVLTEAWMKKHVPDVQVVCRVDSSTVFLDLLRAGVGIGFAPCVDGDADPALARMCDVEPGFGMDFWVLCHPELRGTARVRAFMEHMAEVVVPWKDRFAGTIR